MKWTLLLLATTPILAFSMPEQDPVNPSLRAQAAQSPIAPAGHPGTAVECRLNVNIPVLPLAKYVSTASNIVQAKVIGISNEAVEGQIPLTVYHASVVDQVKGNTPRVIQVRVAGGTSVGGLRTTVDAAPSFAVGEEWLMFLCEDDAPGSFHLLGLRFGAYIVSQESETKTIHGLHAHGTPLDDFRGRIASVDTKQEGN